MTRFNTVWGSERIPEEWRTSIVIFKNKGDGQNCSNYRRIELIRHTIKLWERAVEAKLRREVTISEQQCGFKSITYVMFA